MGVWEWAIALRMATLNGVDAVASLVASQQVHHPPELCYRAAR